MAEAIQDDVNKGIVRMDTSFMHQIGVRPGDIIQIRGERSTVAITDRAYPGDIGLNIIRMDGLIRRNAKASIGDLVTIGKAEVKEAKKVVIAPAREGIVIRANPAVFKQGLLGRAVMKGDVVSLGGARSRRNTLSHSPFFEDVFNMIDESMMGFGLGDLKFIVTETQPKDAVIIVESTEVIFNPDAELKEEKSIDITYEDIGGLEEEVKKVREMIELPLRHPEIFERLGIEPPKGVLLHGPPGTGKTLLAKAVANETNAHFLLINGPEIMSKFYGQSEENLRKKFEEAEKNAPSIIFIDEIDAIASKREETHGEVEKRVVAQLLAMMDGLKSRGKVVVIAATNIPNALDPALRRPGRFDREIDIGVPKKDGRLNILKIHTRNMPLDVSLKTSGVTVSQNELVAKIKPVLDKVDTTKIAQIILDAKEEEKKNELREGKKEPAENVADLLLKPLRPINMPLALRQRLSRVIAGELYSAGVSRETAHEINERLKARLQDLQTAEKIASLLDDAMSEQMLSDIAEITHGFVGADLASLAKEAAMIVLRRILPELKLSEEETIPKEILEKLKVNKEDFKEALKVVRPSALREVLVERPSMKWEDIGGMPDVKQELIEAVEWPIKHKENFTRLGVRPPKGVLLYGAPGTGKTLLAKAVANESNANFILVKGPELLSKWVGESEKAVRKVFQKARQSSPTIIFFDEIDAIAPRRSVSSDSNVTERVVNQLLSEMDGLQELNDVVIVAATNRPDMLDTALLRPGRFDRIILATVPDAAAREEIFKVHTKSMRLAKDVKLKKLVDETPGYVGADIEAVCREAAILTLRDDMKAKEVKMKSFLDALKKVRPSVTKEVEKAYESLKEHFSSAKAKEMQLDKPNYLG